MAYMVEIDAVCSERGCIKRATHEVRNRFNGPIRKCCKVHAEKLVKALNDSEAVAR